MYRICYMIIMQTTATPFQLTYYIDTSGKKPFKEWLYGLRDRAAFARIVTRLERVELGNLGDHKSVGAGVMELRINYGPGYRIYFTQRGPDVVILLCGGDKRRQQRDIERARELARRYDAQSDT